MAFYALRLIHQRFERGFVPADLLERQIGDLRPLQNGGFRYLFIPEQAPALRHHLRAGLVDLPDDHLRLPHIVRLGLRQHAHGFELHQRIIHQPPHDGRLVYGHHIVDRHPKRFRR